MAWCIVTQAATAVVAAAGAGTPTAGTPTAAAPTAAAPAQTPWTLKSADQSITLPETRFEAG